MIIIKIGGGKTINLQNIIADLKNVNEPYIIVHGGNAKLDAHMKQLNKEKKLLTSVDGQTSRYTDPEIIDLMFMTYAGSMNKTIVLQFQKAGINAIGLSGLDGKLIQGKRHQALMTVENGKKKVVRDDMTGTVEEVNTDLLKLLIKNSFVPVITPPILSYDSEAINTDGDKITAKVAVALEADTIVSLIEAPGLLTDFTDPTSLVQSVEKSKIDDYLPSAKGRMKKKLQMSKWALNNNVKQVIITDGRIENPISQALAHKIGTRMYEA